MEKLQKRFEGTVEMMLEGNDGAPSRCVRFLANGPLEPFERVESEYHPDHQDGGAPSLKSKAPVTMVQAAAEIVREIGLLPQEAREALQACRDELLSRWRGEIALKAAGALAAAGGRLPTRELAERTALRLTFSEVTYRTFGPFVVDVAYDEHGCARSWSLDGEFFRGVLETLRNHGRVRHVRARSTGEALVVLAS